MTFAPGHPAKKVLKQFLNSRLPDSRTSDLMTVSPQLPLKFTFKLSGYRHILVSLTLL